MSAWLRTLHPWAEFSISLVIFAGLASALAYRLIERAMVLGPADWITTIDELTLVPAEYSVAGAAFLATLIMGLAVMKRKGIKTGAGPRRNP